MGLIGCPGMSVTIYHYTLRNIPEEQIFHLHGDGSLKSRLGTLNKQDGMGGGEGTGFIWHRIGTSDGSG
jgi:hypothetical protein